MIATSKRNLADLDELKNLLILVKTELINKGIFQWDDLYPNRVIISRDLQQHLFLISESEVIYGSVSFSSEQDLKYTSMPWADPSGHALVIHRLMVHLQDQGKGYGKLLLNFAEEHARSNGYSSIRLDAYSGNLPIIQKSARGR